MKVPVIDETTIQRVVDGSGLADGERFVEEQKELVAFADRAFNALPEDLSKHANLRKQAYIAGMAFALRCIEQYKAPETRANGQTPRSLS